MPEKGLVSVVIPTYNREGTIVRAVDSVLNQDYPHIEVIVVDDGSKDNTAELMANTYSQDTRVRFFRIPNSGVCGARNRGIEEVRGEFVAMLDSDDYWLPGKLSLQIAILNAHPTLSMIWSDMDAIDTSDTVVSKNYLRTMYGAYQNFPSYLDLFDAEWKTENNITYFTGHVAKAFILGNIVHTSTAVIRADRLKQAGKYDQSVHPSEDQDCYYRVCLTGPVALVDAVTMHYQIGHADAASGEARFYELAISSQMVFERIGKRIKNDILIPEDIVTQKKRSLNLWVGAASFHRWKMADARRCFMKHLLHSPTDIRILVYFVFTFIPYSIKLLQFLQRIKR